MEARNEELKALIEAVKGSKEKVRKVMHETYKTIDSESVMDWFVEFCDSADRLVKAAEWEMQKAG